MEEEIRPLNLYETPEEALAPNSAGTETLNCIICATPDGNVVREGSLPHPTWTTASGKAVVLLDAVVLGGPNGLNA